MFLDGWVEECDESHFKDCLQQSKIHFSANIETAIKNLFSIVDSICVSAADHFTNHFNSIKSKRFLIEFEFV